MAMAEMKCPLLSSLCRPRVRQPRDGAGPTRVRGEPNIESVVGDLIDNASPGGRPRERQSSI